jgi:arsenate reductase
VTADKVGVDLAGAYPKPVTDELTGGADVVVTMGCGDTCRIHPGTRQLDLELEDPSGKSFEEVRPIRDEIDRRVRDLVAELVGARP